MSRPSKSYELVSTTRPPANIRPIVGTRSITAANTARGRAKNPKINLALGVILSIDGDVAVDTGRADDKVAAVIGGIIAIIGCHLWAHDKNRPWMFVLWGLAAPIVYLSMMPLKDKTLQ